MICKTRECTQRKEKSCKNLEDSELHCQGYMTIVLCVASTKLQFSIPKSSSALYLHSPTSLFNSSIFALHAAFFCSYSLIVFNKFDWAWSLRFSYSSSNASVSSRNFSHRRFKFGMSAVNLGSNRGCVDTIASICSRPVNLD